MDFYASKLVDGGDDHEYIMNEIVLVAFCFPSLASHVLKILFISSFQCAQFLILMYQG